MTDRILIKVSVTEYCIKFRVIRPAAKLDRSFEMFPMDFEKLEHQTTVVVNDSSSFAVLCKEQSKDTLSIRFVWLSSYGDGPVTGQEQTVKLPFAELSSFAKAGAKKDEPSEWTVLSLECRNRPRLVFCEQENLHAAVTNKKVRRKLVRFLRDHFQWPGTDEIQFCNDSMPYSFFFRELCNGQVGMCGGLILHKQENMDNAYYSIHT